MESLDPFTAKDARIASNEAKKQIEADTNEHSKRCYDMIIGIIAQHPGHPIHVSDISDDEYVFMRRQCLSIGWKRLLTKAAEKHDIDKIWKMQESEIMANLESMFTRNGFKFIAEDSVKQSPNRDSKFAISWEEGSVDQ